MKITTRKKSCFFFLFKASFYLYLIFSTRFRRQFKHIFMKISSKICRQQNRIIPVRTIGPINDTNEDELL